MLQMDVFGLTRSTLYFRQYRQVQGPGAHRAFPQVVTRWFLRLSICWLDSLQDFLDWGLSYSSCHRGFTLIKYHSISSVEYFSQDSHNLGIPFTQVCNIIRLWVVSSCFSTLRSPIALTKCDVKAFILRIQYLRTLQPLLEVLFSTSNQPRKQAWWIKMIISQRDPLAWPTKDVGSLLLGLG